MAESTVTQLRSIAGDAELSDSPSILGCPTFLVFLLHYLYGIREMPKNSGSNLHEPRRMSSQLQKRSTGGRLDSVSGTARLRRPRTTSSKSLDPPISRKKANDDVWYRSRYIRPGGFVDLSLTRSSHPHIPVISSFSTFSWTA